MTKNTLMSQVKSWTTTQTNGGVKGLEYLKLCIEHIRDHNDWTPLAWMMGKNAPRDVQRFRAIVGMVTEGLSMSNNSKEAKEQPSGYHFKKSKDFKLNNRFGILCELVDRKCSFRGNEVASELLAKEPKEFDLDQAAKAYIALLKKLENKDISLDQVLKLVALKSTANADLIEKPVIAPKKAVA